MAKAKLARVCLAGLIVLVGLLTGCGPSAATPAAQFDVSEADVQAIRQTASDYIDGWYEGNVERMERSLYDQLAKRWITSDRVDTTTKWQMLDMTEAGGGKDAPGEKKNTITILDVYENVAMVRTDSPEYVDYLQMGKVNGKWIIINVLWAPKEAE